MLETRWTQMVMPNSAAHRGDFAVKVIERCDSYGKIVIMRIGVADGLYGIPYAIDNNIPMYVLATITTHTRRVAFGHATPLVTKRNGGTQIVGVAGYEADSLSEAKKQHLNRLKALSAETLEFETLPMRDRQPNPEEFARTQHHHRYHEEKEFVAVINEMAEEPYLVTDQQVNLPEALADLFDEETMLVEMNVVEDEYGPLGVDLVIAMRDHDWSQQPSEQLLAKRDAVEDGVSLWNRYAPSVFTLS